MTISEQTVTGPRGGLPHGGQLVDRRLDAEEASALASSPLPSLPLTAAEAADLRALATGAYSPLTGFMGAKEHESVTESMRLPDGTLWSIPVCLGIPDGVRVDDGRLALRGEGASCWACSRSPRCSSATGPPRPSWSTAPATPSTPGWPGCWAPPAGPWPAPSRPWSPPGRAGGRAGPDPGRDPGRVRLRGWGTVVGFQTRNPVHRAHEYLMKCALEMVDGLLLHPLVGPTKEGDVPAEVRMRAYEAVLGYFPPRAGPAVRPGRAHALRRAPRGRAHALVRKNYGCTHFIVGRDHAGVGSYYGTFEAQELIASLPAEDLGITPLRFDNAFYCRRCLAMATGKTCPHPDSDHVALSGTQVRTMLAAGQLPTAEFSRAEVAELLIEAYRS